MPTNFALLGAGRIGRVHAGAIARDPRARLVAVADPVAAAARAVADARGCAVTDAAAIEADAAIDAVVICTPTNTHAGLIERFARAGKAIFCEKPVDLSVARVRACLAVVAATGARLMIGFNRRFDPHFAAVRQAIDAGRIGAVELVTITSRDPAPPPPAYVAVSGGLFRDMTIHDFDMARFLLGEEVATVMATGAVLVDPAIGLAGDIDTAAVILRTASGRQALITNSRRASYGYDQRVEVHGAKGAVAAGNPRPALVEVATAEGYLSPPLHDFFMTRYADAYAAEIAAFIDALERGAPMAPSGADGLAALVLAEAAGQSMREGRAVRVEEIAG